MIGGVTLVPHDPRWRDAFEVESSRIKDALGSLLVEIEHIGSTSIPGIVAKPTIDIAATIRSFDDAARCVESLTPLGYHYVPRYEEELPNRRYFRSDARGPAGERLFHLHVYEHLHPEYLAYLTFRDRLRSNPAAAREYEALKLRLAASVPRERYPYGKASFVASILGGDP